MNYEKITLYVGGAEAFCLQPHDSLPVLSSFSSFINAVQAYYNCCPSCTLRITSIYLSLQKTDRLAAHLMPHEVLTVYPQSPSVCTGNPISPWKCLLQLSIWMCRHHQKWVVLVVCRVGISPLRNLRISFSCGSSARSGLGSRRHIGQSLYD